LYAQKSPNIKRGTPTIAKRIIISIGDAKVTAIKLGGVWEANTDIPFVFEKKR
jgi:hypothetical protein